MLYFMSGVVVAGAGASTLWYLRPRNGQVNLLALKPVLEWLIPIGIVTAVAFGAAQLWSAFLTDRGRFSRRQPAGLTFTIVLGICAIWRAMS